VAVANDGDVAALAGAMELGEHPVLGIAMGTSLAAGYVDRRALITGWLNELAFAPIDYAHEAQLDHEWSGDRGTGVNYLSQDAAIRLAPRVGVVLPDTAPPGERLRLLQEMLKRGDDRIASIFETIGVFFGYALLHYSHFYELKHVLVLGRVTSGVCGELIVQKAREALHAEDPALAEQVKLHLPDEAQRRVGQSIAAASLPRGAAS
jgi:predicted NBD/HSP70 family sugar kinase